MVDNGYSKSLIKIEGNLCEYPFFILSKSKKNENKEERKSSCREYDFGIIILEDGSIAERKLIIRSPEDIGLPSAFEQDILIALSYIGTVDKTLTERINFTLHEVANLLEQPTHKTNIKNGILKMAHATCTSEYTVLTKDKKGKNRYLKKEEVFHIFERISFWDDKETISNRKARETTWVKFNEYFLQNFLSGYFQYIDFSVYQKLKRPIVKRLYIFLSKKKFGRPSFKISINKLALAIPIEAKRLSDIRKILKDSCKCLVDIGFISHYKLERGAIDIIFYFPDKEIATKLEEQNTLDLSNEKQNLYDKLINIGITDGVVKQLIQDYPIEKIEQQLEWLNHRTKIDDPAGALVSAIKDSWSVPKEVMKKKKEKDGQKQIENILGKVNKAKYIIFPSGKKCEILKVLKNAIEFIDENERRMILFNQILDCSFEDK